MVESGKSFELLREADHDGVLEAECGCCRLKEKCTQDYIVEVKKLHAGIWVCGLCSEVLKEHVSKNPEITMEEAVNGQREICHKLMRNLKSVTIPSLATNPLAFHRENRPL